MYGKGFHKVNVSAIRITNAPILLLLSLHERRYLWQRARQLTPPRRVGWLASLETFGPHKDLSAVFDADPPQGKPRCLQLATHFQYIETKDANEMDRYNRSNGRRGRDPRRHRGRRRLRYCVETSAKQEREWRRLGSVEQESIQ